MFYRTKIKDHIRVPPEHFDKDIDAAITTMIKKKYEGYISKDLGIVIDVSSIGEIGEGVLIPGDGATYYNVEFQLLNFKPELHEVLYARVKDIADFGAFMTIGPSDGMIHISQTMNDFVSFGKDKVLLGKESKRNLKIGDLCRARVIAVSYKDLSNPKFGLTMRQEGLGRLDWIEEDLSKSKKPATMKKAQPAKK
ncbi:DNA-directed RNA polymerase [Candidatus Woesearchaeota archaeon]|nr:DNA-directed RNA polymerase [Candidatus Woesearchaeota archaeon]